MYTATIIISVVLYIFVLMLIVGAIADKDLRTFLIWMSIFCAFISLLVISAVYTQDKRNAEHPYTKTYTIKLHYLDGGTEIKTFNCEGWQEPYMRRYRASYSLIVGDYETYNVSRYYILKTERHLCEQ